VLRWEPAGRRSAAGWAGGGVRAEVAALAPSVVLACRRKVKHRPEVPGRAMVSAHRPPFCGRVGGRWSPRRGRRVGAFGGAGLPPRSGVPPVALVPCPSQFRSAGGGAAGSGLSPVVASAAA
jgi:hypothetical protein